MVEMILDSFLQKELFNNNIDIEDFKIFYNKLYEASIRNSLDIQTPNQKEVYKIIQNYTVYFETIIKWYCLYRFRVGDNPINIDKDGQIKALKD